MARIEWSPRSQRELHDIQAYIYENSPHYAQRFVRQLIQRVEKLVNFPESGERVFTGSLLGCREILFGNYRIFYRFDNQLIEIITVFHAARSMDDMDFTDS
jgi:toxin ParE1/3/4